MLEFIKQPWPWYIAGPMIAGIMFFMLFFGRNFGVSANLRTLCTIGGAGKFSDFFKFDWKGQVWNLMFVLGSIIGGYIASNFLSEANYQMELSSTVISEMKSMGISQPGKGYLPEELFGWQVLSSIKGILILVIGGFLVGFGARYAGGCTSGHAISGLSNLQVPSLIAVIGFFIGGLTMTYLIIPILL